jgi:hypothetical protein
MLLGNLHKKFNLIILIKSQKNLIKKLIFTKLKNYIRKKVIPSIKLKKLKMKMIMNDS